MMTSVAQVQSKNPLDGLAVETPSQYKGHVFKPKVEHSTTKVIDAQKDGVPFNPNRLHMYPGETIVSEWQVDVTERESLPWYFWLLVVGTLGAYLILYICTMVLCRCCLPGYGKRTFQRVVVTSQGRVILFKAELEHVQTGTCCYGTDTGSGVYEQRAYRIEDLAMVERTFERNRNMCLYWLCCCLRFLRIISGTDETVVRLVFSKYPTAIDHTLIQTSYPISAVNPVDASGPGKKYWLSLLSEAGATMFRLLTQLQTLQPWSPSLNIIEIKSFTAGSGVEDHANASGSARGNAQAFIHALLQLKQQKPALQVAQGSSGEFDSNFFIPIPGEQVIDSLRVGRFIRWYDMVLILGTWTLYYWLVLREELKRNGRLVLTTHRLVFYAGTQDNTHTVVSYMLKGVKAVMIGDDYNKLSIKTKFGELHIRLPKGGCCTGEGESKSRVRKFSFAACYTAKAKQMLDFNQLSQSFPSMKVVGEPKLSSSAGEDVFDKEMLLPGERFIAIARTDVEQACFGALVLKLREMACCVPIDSQYLVITSHRLLLRCQRRSYWTGCFPCGSVASILCFWRGFSQPSYISVDLENVTGVSYTSQAAKETTRCLGLDCGCCCPPQSSEIRVHVGIDGFANAASIAHRATSSTGMVDNEETMAFLDVLSFVSNIEKHMP